MPDQSGKTRKPKRPPSVDSIQLGLILGKENQPTPCLANVMAVLSRHQDWQGVLAYDEFGQSVVSLKPPPTRDVDKPAEHTAGEWTEEDSIRTASWITSNLDFAPRVEFVHQAVRTISRRRLFHPVREYFAKIEWDSVPRLNKWLSKYFGAHDNEYCSGVGSRWLISAVARIMRPGCQADCMLVLEGLQGIGKSSAFKALAGAEWFADTPLDMGNKDSYQGLRRKLIYEMGELASLKGREAERTKAFVSASVDNYRPSFGQRNQDFPRQVIFAGTTNETEYLTDRTGARRFWPVHCTKVDVQGIRADRDQLWAEAYARFLAEEPWHVNTAELHRLCQEEQEQRRPDDPWKEMLVKWLENPKIEEFETTTVYLHAVDGISVTEAILGCLKKKRGDLRDFDSQKMGKTFQDLGWARRRKFIAGVRSWAYFPPHVGGTLFE